MDYEKAFHHIQHYVLTALDSFDNDPPDSPFQRGYQAALKAIQEEAIAPTITSPQGGNSTRPGA